MQESLAALLAERFPALIRTAQQRHIIGMLGIRKPNGACAPGEGGQRIGQCALLEPQHPHAARGQFAASGCAHRAHARHNDLIRHARSLTREAGA